MVWLLVDKDGCELVTNDKPKGDIEWWLHDCYIYHISLIELPKGSIKKLIGKELTWKDEPFELK